MTTEAGALALTDKQKNYLDEIEVGGELSPHRFEPRNLDSLMRFAGMIAGSSLCPKNLSGKPSDVALQVIRGAELGLTTMNSLQQLYVIHGKVGIDATLLRALCQQHPECEYFEIDESTLERAVVKVRKRSWPKGEHKTAEYTFEEAQKAGLTSKDNWKNYRRDMLVARATSRGASLYFPNVKAGLYLPEELEELVEKNVTPQGDEAAERAAKIVKAAKEVKAEPEPEESEDPGPAGASLFEDGEQQSEDEPPTPTEPSATPPTHETMAEPLAAELMKLPRVGQTTIEAMESAGVLTAHQVVAFGNPSKLSAAVKGVGGQKAEHIFRRCEEILDEGDQIRENEPESAPEPEGEPEPSPEPAEPESEPPAAKATRFRSEDYVQGLRELMGEQGVTFSQVKTYAAEKLGHPVSYWNDLLALPDPDWKKLEDWIKSAVQTELPIGEEVEEEPAPKKAEAVEYITAGRVRVLGETVEKMTAELSEKDKAAWMDTLGNYLHEKHGVPNGQKMAAKIPASAYLDVLGWLTDNDPRSA